MKKAKTPHHPLTPRWIPRSIIGAILVFAGFAGYQMVFAAGVFTNPGCDPTATAGPAACNTAAPLLSNPNNETATATLATSGSQLIRTPLQIGYSGQTTPSPLDLFNMVNLQPGAKIQTQGTFTGQAINVTSAGDHAIVGTSSFAGKAGVYGLATNSGAYGVYALNSAGNATSYALFADGGASSNAAKFAGPVLISKGAQIATLTVDATGNLDIATAAGKGLTVNGLPAAGSLKGITVPGVGAQGAITAYDVATNVLGVGKKYPVTSLSVMYRDPASATPDYWKPIATTSVNYRECNGATFAGSLELTNPVATPEYRVYIGYDAMTTVICTGSDTTAPTSVSVSGMVTNGWYGSSTVTITGTATENDGLGLTAIDFYDSVAGGAATLLGTTTCVSGCTTSNKTLTYSWNAGAAASTWANPANTHSLSVKARSAGGTSAFSTAVAVKTYAPADSRQACLGNIITCATTQFCCGSSFTNNGLSGLACKDFPATPYTCTSSSATCGQCVGGGS